MHALTYVYLCRVMGVHVILLLALFPCCLAYRDGARSDSCYDHRVEHIIPNSPPIAKIVCDAMCNHVMTISGEYDYENRVLINSSVGAFQCGSVYQRELIDVFLESALINLFFAVILTTTVENGFLVQARGSGNTFQPDSDILGEFLPDILETPMYKILRCGRNRDNQGETFNVSCYGLEIYVGLHTK